MKSPFASSSTNRKVSGVMKRQLERESEESDREMVERPSPLKKGRMNEEVLVRPRASSVGSDDSVEERDVALSLLQSSPCSQRSKRRWIMESVEVPSFEEVLLRRRLQRTTSLESFVGSVDVKTPSKPGGRVIRKMRPSSKSARKSCVFDPFISSSSPISAIPLSSNVGAAKLKRTASAPMPSSSSDDDPRYGQVTPHHLISPAPKKVLDVSDPPSDDSLPPSSPTRAVVSRRSLKRRVSVT